MKVCASGSLLGASMNCVSVSFLVLIMVVISFGLCGGGGGFLTPTVLVVCVIITPLPVNVPVASLARAVEPGKGIVPSDAAVILNVLVPVRKTFGGFGFAFAFLKKNEPSRSPQLSDIKSIFVTVA